MDITSVKRNKCRNRPVPGKQESFKFPDRVEQNGTDCLIRMHVKVCALTPWAQRHSCIRLERGHFRIQQAGKILVSRRKVVKSGKALKSGTLITGDGVRYPWKGIFNFKNHTSWQKLKRMSHFVFLHFYFGAKNARHGNSLVVRRVSQARPS